MRSSGEFDLDAVRALHDDAAALAGELSDLASRFEAGPATEDDLVVDVTLDIVGMVTAVELSPDWRAMVGPGGLGRAVASAVERACADQAARDQVDADVAERAGGAGINEGIGVGSSQEASGRWVPGDPGSAASASSRRDLMALLDVFESQLTVPETSASGSTGEVRGTNPNGTVSVRMTNEGALVSVDFDHAWLAAAEHGRIGLAIRDALQDAQQQSAPLPRKSSASSPAAAELRRLTEQPEMLLRKLGLIR